MNIKTPAKTALLMLASLSLLACSDSQINANNSDDLARANQTNSLENSSTEIWPTLDFDVKKDDQVELKIIQLLAGMTLEQKVAQMIQPEIRDITPEDMRKYGFGSYLNGGGAFPNNNKHATPQDWVNLAEQMYQASIDDSLDGSTIPTMWGTDAVHGHNNVIGATLFPHNIGLGAANNPELLEKIAQITATEVMVTGIDWVFAPTVATVRDDRWGRTYEGYSEDPEIVRTYAKAIVQGLQGHAGETFLADNRVISTVKHFLGDGGTQNGDDQGNNIDDEQALFDLHAQGYISGLAAGSQSVMASFNSWHGKKNHGNQYLLTEVLKEKMGFDGFVVGDWNGHGQIRGCSNESCPQSINAGLDIFMVPTDAWKPLYENTIKQVQSGEILESRINDAVSRILRVKLRAGLFEKPSPAQRMFSGKTELIGSKAHRDVAKQAVRESLVLLKNKAGILPLSPKLNMLVAGDGADNIGKQSGGWSITWQGTNNKNTDFPGGSSIYQGLVEQVSAAGGSIHLNEQGEYQQKPDVAVVVFGEEPYAEGPGDRSDLAYKPDDRADLALLKRLQTQGIPSVCIFISGRPMWVNAELNACDAFVAAWLPGSEGNAVAEVLLTDANEQIQYDFTGKLSFSWPITPQQNANRFDENYQPLFPYGYGLQYGQASTVADDLSEVYVAADNAEQSVDVFTTKANGLWKMNLTSAKQSLEILSNSASLPGVNYRTVDRVVQEDAFRLTWTGNTEAGLSFNAINHLGVDASRIAKNNAAIIFKVKRESEVNTQVMLAMECVDEVNDHCAAVVDITDMIAATPANEWLELAVASQCFSKKGVNVKQLAMPFALTAQGTLVLAISDIRIAMPDETTRSLQCD